MKELESSRMNFLQQRHGALTYRTMIIGMAAWCGILAALYGLQNLRAWDARKELAGVKQQVEQLNAEKDAQIKLLETAGKQRLGGAAKEDLKAILSSRPHWSRILRQLTRNMPPQVWLGSVKSSQLKGEEYQLEVAGYAKSQRALTNFIMGLESNGYFRKTELVGTKKGGAEVSGKDEAFSFDIVTTPILRKF